MNIFFCQLIVTVLQHKSMLETIQWAFYMQFLKLVVVSRLTLKSLSASGVCCTLGILCLFQNDCFGMLRAVRDSSSQMKSQNRKFQFLFFPPDKFESIFLMFQGLEQRGKMDLSKLPIESYLVRFKSTVSSKLSKVREEEVFYKVSCTETAQEIFQQISYLEISENYSVSFYHFSF